MASKEFRIEKLKSSSSSEKIKKGIYVIVFIRSRFNSGKIFNAKLVGKDTLYLQQIAVIISKFCISSLLIEIDFFKSTSLISPAFFNANCISDKSVSLSLQCAKTESIETSASFFIPYVRAGLVIAKKR